VNLGDWVKPVEVVDLTKIDYSVHTLDEIVAFEKSEHDTPKKRSHEGIIRIEKKVETPPSDEAEEAGSEEDEEEDRQTKLFEKNFHDKRGIDLCSGESSEDEETSRSKAQRFADDDEVDAPATTSSSTSTTPYSQNLTLKSTVGRTPYATAVVTTKKRKGKKTKGQF